MLRINTLPLLVYQELLVAVLSMCITLVNRTGYPRINTLPSRPLPTHKHSTFTGLAAHKHSTDLAAKPSATRDSEGFLYVVYLYVKTLPISCLRLSVESRDKAAPSHIRLGAQTAFA